MVKIVPDEVAVKQILEAVDLVMKAFNFKKDLNSQKVGLHKSGRIEWYTSLHQLNKFSSVPLVTYTRTVSGIQVEYDSIVRSDDILHAQFEEAFRVAMLNNP